MTIYTVILQYPEECTDGEFQHYTSVVVANSIRMSTLLAQEEAAKAQQEDGGDIAAEDFTPLFVFMGDVSHQMIGYPWDFRGVGR
jgi:hypothetical protein